MATATIVPPAAFESPQCLTTNLGWLLSHASHVLATEQVAALAPLGLGPRGYCVLSAALQEERTQTELANLIGIDKTTMVVTVDELEHAGLVKRIPSRSDRRARVIAVTKAGERKVAQGDEITAALQADVLAAIPARDRKTFLEALNVLVSDRLSEPVECSPGLRRREPRA
jgi:MarR family transcriptional regulator for hemolysin